MLLSVDYCVGCTLEEEKSVMMVIWLVFLLFLLTLCVCVFFLSFLSFPLFFESVFHSIRIVLRIDVVIVIVIRWGLFFGSVYLALCHVNDNDIGLSS